MEYHKIDTVFKRNKGTNHKTLIMGDYSTPEFAYLANNEWVFTEKVDGTNIRVMIGGGKVVFGGRTDAAAIPAPLVAWLKEKFAQEDDLLETFPRGACLYGEGYGPKIQNGHIYRGDQAFVLFDVLVGDWWLARDDVKDVASVLSLDVVPLVGSGTLHDMVDMAASGFQSAWGSFTAEGIVARPAVEIKTRAGHRIITKIKHRDFQAQTQDRRIARA